jgi:hypothetical protein
MSARVLAVLLAFLIGPGCVHSVFDGPVIVSTKARGARDLTPIRAIAVERCDLLIAIVPIVEPPGEAYDELLDRAEELGGTAIIDFQHAYTSIFQIIPLFTRVCWEARGTAAKSS